MALFCPVTGLKVFSVPEWINQKVSDSFIANFWIIEDSIIYSLPKGRADLKGVRNSIALKNKVGSFVSGSNGPYIQIQDYALLRGSSTEARRYFTSNMNHDKRLLAAIFCNLSLSLSIAVNVGRRFNTTGKDIHIVRHYEDAIKRALELSDQEDLKIDIALKDLCKCFKNIDCSLSPVELLSEDAWNIQTPEYSNQAVVIDQCILHSTSEGNLESKHIPLIEHARDLCQSAIPDDSKIKYLVLDSSKLKGASRLARSKYMQSLKSWHKRFPLRMYIIYGANTFIKTALHLGRPLMPFRVKIAKDIDHAFQLIRNDRSENFSKKHEIQESEKLAEITHEDIEKLIAIIASINWEQEGIENIFDLGEDHPIYFLYQSIRLIKEELDNVFKERNRLAARMKASLYEKELLLREIHHRVKNNMQVISSLLKIQARHIKDKQAAEKFKESQDRITSMSLIHEQLYQSNDLSRIDFGSYVNKLVNSLRCSFGPSAEKIAVNIECEDIFLGIDVAIPLGLIVNELVSNSFKYAFPSKKEGTVSISLRRTQNNWAELTIGDSGVGMPEDLDFSNLKTFGIELVRDLAEHQLSGRIEIKHNGRTEFRIKFKA